MIVQEKVATLTTNLRRLWPKYDTDLNQFVQGMPSLLQLFEHFFIEAKLQEDYDHFKTQMEG